MTRMLTATAAMAATLAALACGPPPEPDAGSIVPDITVGDPPAAPGAMGPNLSVSPGGALLSWIEPAAEGPGKALRFAALSRERGAWAWGPPATIVAGTDFFANWADFPSIIAAGDGSLVAHWLAKSGAGTYAYDVQLARSTDGGATWERLGPANDDGTQTEHGFVSLIGEGSGVRAFWLDGREMAAGAHGGDEGAMTLRTAIVADGVSEPERLDARVCECCQTSAVVTADGPLVVYRDRSESEIRDVYIVRRTPGGWSQPSPVSEDGWEVPGCPVNGPSVAVGDDGRAIAVAWFTAAGAAPRVNVAFSSDSGASFGAPVLVDGGDPIGRVDVVMDAGGDAIVVWLAGAEGEAADIRVRRVRPDGSAGDAVTVSATSRSRASGFPRVARLGEDLAIVWTEAGDPSRLRATTLGLADVPPAVPARAPEDGEDDGAPGRSWDTRPGSAAPSFEASGLDGTRISLSDLRGQAVLLNVWATWCLPCREETPDLIALHDRYSGEGLRVVGVSVDEADAADDVRRFVADGKIGYTVLLDPEDEASRIFRLPMLPATFLFDRDGVLVWSRVGVVGRDDPDLLEAIGKALRSGGGPAL